MNNKVNYTVVGFIVLIGIVLMSAFAYWMLKPSDNEKVKTYLIYFDESVSGLNLEAPVKYRGIAVGKVTGLRINPKNSEEVEVKISILASTPIKVNTAARLTAQGITGLTFINLSLGKKDAPELVKHDGEEYPVIKTVPSFFRDVKSSFGSVTEELSATLIKMETLLDKRNQENLSMILLHTANVTKKLDTLLDKETILALQHTAQHLDASSRKVDAMIPNIDKLIDKSIEWEKGVNNSLASIMQSYLVIRGTMDSIGMAVQRGDFNLKEITSDITPTLNRTMDDLQEVLINLEETLKDHQRSPSDILFKSEEMKKAPGE